MKNINDLGLFNDHFLMETLTKLGYPLQKLYKFINWKIFELPINETFKNEDSDLSKEGRPPFNRLIRIEHFYRHIGGKISLTFLINDLMYFFELTFNTMHKIKWEIYQGKFCSASGSGFFDRTSPLPYPYRDGVWRPIHILMQ